jgi:transcription-repair coupling factor (superfamily II helicase)
MIDRFGLLPEPTKTLFSITWLKLISQSIGIRRLRAGPTGGVIDFAENAQVDPVKLVELIEADRDRFRLDGPYRLRFSWDTVAETQLLAEVESLLIRLGGTDPDSAPPQ